MGTFLLRRSGIDWVKTVFNGGIIYLKRQKRKAQPKGGGREEGRQRKSSVVLFERNAER